MASIKVIGKTATRPCDKKFKLAFDSVIGRHLVATADINPGALIVDEPPIIRGPCIDLNIRDDINTTSTCVCCVCFQAFEKYDKPITCEACCCSLFCSEDCKTHAFHVEEECNILKIVPGDLEKLNVQIYCNLISIIRCLLTRKKNPLQWNQICNLESKLEVFTKMKTWEHFDNIFQKLTWSDFGIESSHLATNLPLDSKFSILAAARHCYGVLRTNAYSHLKHSFGFEGLYFFASLMAHSCQTNTDRNFDTDREGRMVVKAAVKIKAGEIITTTYLSLLNNTRERHATMQNNWQFTCACRRCQDPSELETYLSTTYCTNDGEAEYAIVDSIRKRQPLNMNDIDSLEQWLQEFDTGKILHPNHSVFGQVKLYLSLTYGRQSGGIEALSETQLLRKYAMCCQTLYIFDIIYPGIYQCKGELIFELWLAAREIHSRGLDSKLHAGHTPELLAEMAYKILKHAIPRSPFHEMYSILEYEYQTLFTNVAP